MNNDEKQVARLIFMALIKIAQHIDREEWWWQLNHTIERAYVEVILIVDKYSPNPQGVIREGYDMIKTITYAAAHTGFKKLPLLQLSIQDYLLRLDAAYQQEPSNGTN